MFNHHRDRLSEVTPAVLFRWFLLSFMAGNINAGGYLACSRFVTHLTGFATLMGIDFAMGDYRAGFGMLAVPLFFVLGVMISAHLVDRRLNSGRRPRYALVMGIVAGALTAVAIAGEFRLFGAFDAEIYLKKDFYFMALLCAASGLTNAALTTASGAFVRITHLTGIVTDFGIGLTRMRALDKNTPAYRTERTANLYRVGTFFAFGFGSCVGALLFIRIHYLGFLLPAAVAAYASSVALYNSTQHATESGKIPQR